MPILGALAIPGVRAGGGVNQKTFENLQRPRQSGVSRLLFGVGTTLHRFSMVSEGALKHSPGGLFLLTFLDKQKSKENLIFFKLIDICEL